MGALARYRKAGGFLQLVTLLEGLGSTKFDQLMKIIHEEDPKWHKALQSKILTFDRITQWPDSALMEILNHAKPLTVGTAIFGLEENLIQRFRSLIPNTSRIGVGDVLTYENPSPAKVESARLQVAQLARHLVTEGQIALKSFAPDLLIPDDIEELLAAGRAAFKTEREPEPQQTKILKSRKDLEAENKRLQDQVVKLTRELESLRGHGRQAA